MDKIRLLSLTDKSVLDATSEMNIRIKADKDTGMLHITDTGIGMTKQDLVNNLGTIAKSGTAEFLGMQMSLLYRCLIKKKYYFQVKCRMQNLVRI